MELDTATFKPFADKILALYRQKLQDKGIDASGTLSQTATSEVDIDGTKLIISLNLEDYWKYVEYGRGPGKFPPPDAIINWIKVKPIIPNPINGKVPDTRQLAFLIGRKISREGTPGRKPISEMVYSDTIETMIQDIKNIIAGQIITELQDTINKP